MPISDCEVRDPRIRRTRQLLQNALRSLMQVRSLDEIPVGDITEAATVNRATFYDHYTDKFSLFEALIAGEFHQLLNERQISFDAARPSSLKPIVAAVCDYLTQTHSLAANCHRQSAFEPLFDAAVTTALRHLFAAGLEEKGTPSSSLVSAIAANATSWAIYGAVKQWFQTPDRPPTEEIVESILPLLLPMVKAARNRA